MPQSRRATSEALEQMRASGEETTRWAAYQNKAFDSSLAGHLQFLAVGPDNTYKEPPRQYPADTVNGAGWRYRFVGWVDLTTGEIKEEAMENKETIKYVLGALSRVRDEDLVDNGLRKALLRKAGRAVVLELEHTGKARVPFVGEIKVGWMWFHGAAAQKVIDVGAAFGGPIAKFRPFPGLRAAIKKVYKTPESLDKV